jgi:predicted RNA-binding protein with RPS1 domain
MLHDLLVDMKLDQLDNYRYLETSAIEAACSEIEAAQLQEILRKYTSDENTFTGLYLHGRSENIKILVDIGQAVETPEAAAEMYQQLQEREPLYFRLLMEVFKSWCKKTAETYKRADAGVHADDDK